MQAGLLHPRTSGPSSCFSWSAGPASSKPGIRSLMRPADVRGPFASIATRVPGVRISEHLPRLAQRMDRLAIIRSVHHEEAPIHETGCQLLQTGRALPTRRGSPPFRALGRTLARIAGTACRLSPSYPDPSRPPESTSRMARRPPGSAPDVLRSPSARIRPASTFDAHAVWARAQAASSESSSNASAENPFDLAREPAPSAMILDAPRSAKAACSRAFGGTGRARGHGQHVRDRVQPAHLGLSRRGAVQHAGRLRSRTAAGFRSRLLGLDRRSRSPRPAGITFVVAAGEFGRTPRLNSAGGRDHWPGVWSVAIAGGGIRGGQVVGASDRMPPIRQTARSRRRSCWPRSITPGIDRCEFSRRRPAVSPSPSGSRFGAALTAAGFLASGGLSPAACTPARR